MASPNNNQGSRSATPEPPLQSTSTNCVVQSETSRTLPKTPPNTRTISPPRTPRPRRTFRAEGMRLSEQSWKRFEICVTFKEPTRFTLGSIAALELSSEQTIGWPAPQLLPSLFIDGSGFSTNNHSSVGGEVDMQYMNMLSIAGQHPKEHMAADVSSRLQGEENAESNLTEGSFKEHDIEDEVKDESDESDEKNEKEDDIWSWKL